ncbi:hypothetical protein EYB26_008771 [Talaromyces marneffei]|nr:uncharacterized protein EYB26_008771 [Talaromyces marneffei]QGA21061.1 hypothetical protein EYB26_008771 [Talaromyces marneffei]
MMMQSLLFWSLLLRGQQARSQEQMPIGIDQPGSADDETDCKYNFPSPAPHIFSSVNGLLQQWANTFFPIGHGIVPCHISPFTNLYHGRQDGNMPESPEWVAFDIEMPYGIMGSERNSHILTYQTTKQIGCLYFDGESATLFGSGMMDTQMLFIYGNVTGPRVDDGHGLRGLEDEYNRASGLCKWVQDKGLGGLGWGMEGIVRMNAGFEMIWCNFTSLSLRLLTKTNVTAPLLREIGKDSALEDRERKAGTAEIGKALIPEYTSTSPGYYPLPTDTSPPGHSKDPEQPPMPPSWRLRGQEPFLESQTWGWFESATWHYGSTGMGAGRGESRVKPLTCGFLTFYNPIYHEQQIGCANAERKRLNLTMDGHWTGSGTQEDRKAALEQLTRRKRHHSLRNITVADAHMMNDAAERVLKSLDFNNSDRLRSSYATNNNCTGIDWTGSIDTENSTAVRTWFMALRQHTHFLLMPHFEYPPESADHHEMSTLGEKTLSKCQYQYTRLLAPDFDTVQLTPEEALIMSAVEETLGNICLWVVTAGLAIEREWLDRFERLQYSSPGTKSFTALVSRLNSWQTGLEELMAWLGWVDQWTYCKDGCAQDEI